MAVTDIYHITGSMRPSYPSVAFLGGATADYVQVDDSAVDQVAANYTSGTWMARIMPLDKTQTGTIIGAGDKNAVEFIELNIEAGLLVARCTDAAVAQWVLTSDAVVIKPHTWTCVTLVHDSVRPWLYVNGVKIAQTLSTATTPATWFAATDGIDSMRIGAANKAGDDSVTQEFGGGIGCVAIWGGLTTTGALTDEQIKLLASDDLTPFTAKPPYNYWLFDGDYIDLGSGADNGTAAGDVILSQGYCEFESRFRNHGFITADYPVVAIDNGAGHVFIIKSA